MNREDTTRQRWPRRINCPQSPAEPLRAFERDARSALVPVEVRVGGRVRPLVRVEVDAPNSSPATTPIASAPVSAEVVQNAQPERAQEAGGVRADPRPEEYVNRGVRVAGGIRFCTGCEAPSARARDSTPSVTGDSVDGAEGRS